MKYAGVMGGGKKKRKGQSNLGYKIQISPGSESQHSEQCWPDARELLAGSAMVATTDCFLHLSQAICHCLPPFQLKAKIMVAISCQLLL